MYLIEKSHHLPKSSFDQISQNHEFPSYINAKVSKSGIELVTLPLCVGKHFLQISIISRQISIFSDIREPPSGIFHGRPRCDLMRECGVIERDRWLGKETRVHEGARAPRGMLYIYVVWPAPSNNINCYKLNHNELAGCRNHTMAQARSHGFQIIG